MSPYIGFIPFLFWKETKKEFLFSAPISRET